jgi:hypothetical protein
MQNGPSSAQTPPMSSTGTLTHCLSMTKRRMAMLKMSDQTKQHHSTATKVSAPRRNLPPCVSSSKSVHHWWVRRSPAARHKSCVVFLGGSERKWNACEWNALNRGASSLISEHHTHTHTPWCWELIKRSSSRTATFFGMFPVAQMGATA